MALVGVADDQFVGGDWTISCATQINKSYEVSLVAKYAPIPFTANICSASPAPESTGGDQSPTGGASVITISRVTVL
jgi:hypothetical protein